MTFAGTPPTMAYGGTSLVTTAHAPTTAPFPIVTPPITTTLLPIHTSCPIRTGLKGFATVLEVQLLPTAL